MKVVAAILLALAIPVTLFCGYQLFFDPDGAISGREAEPFFYLGAALSVVLAIVTALPGKKKQAPAAASYPQHGHAHQGYPQHGHFQGHHPQPLPHDPSGRGPHGR